MFGFGPIRTKSRDYGNRKLTKNTYRTYLRFHISKVAFFLCDLRGWKTDLEFKPIVEFQEIHQFDRIIELENAGESGGDFFSFSSLRYSVFVFIIFEFFPALLFSLALTYLFIVHLEFLFILLSGSGNLEYWQWLVQLRSGFSFLCIFCPWLWELKFVFQERTLNAKK